MEQYERLWQYQQVDMELDQYEKEMRGNSNRKELLKHRDFLLEQQNVLKKIEADVEIMGDRMEALADEIERLNGSVAEASANFEAHRPEDLEEAKKQIAALQKLITTISRYESELAKMRKDSEARDRQQREVVLYLPGNPDGDQNQRQVERKGVVFKRLHGTGEPAKQGGAPGKWTAE